MITFLKQLLFYKTMTMQNMFRFDLTLLICSIILIIGYVFFPPDNLTNNKTLINENTEASIVKTSVIDKPQEVIVTPPVIIKDIEPKKDSCNNLFDEE